MLNFSIVIIIFSFLIGCSHTGLERRDVDEYFMSSGVARYFLPDLPAWANYSQSANCHRQEIIRYFDLQKLRKSFSLNYAQSVQLQVMFNEQRAELLEDTNMQAMPLKQEERLFYTISDKVQGGVFTTNLPTFKRIHLVWIDPVINNVSKLKGLLDRDSFQAGHPVFVSLCMTSAEVDKFLLKNNLDNQNIRKISYEYFSLYSPKGERKTKMLLDFEQIFTKEQNLYFYSPKKELPSEFEGKYNVRNF